MAQVNCTPRIASVAAAFGIALGLASGAVSPASAQDVDLSTKEVRAVTHSYAQCVVKRQPTRAAAAIRENLDNAILLRKYPQLIVSDCLRRSPGEVLTMRFTGDLYRYALADALVNREFPGSNAPDISRTARLDHRDPGAPPLAVNRKGKKLSAKKYQAALEQHQKAGGFAYLSRYGECVVRSAPAAAKELLRATPDSAEETARFKALSLALSTCLPEGQTLKFGKVTLRGTIAVNYYRLAVAARAAAPGMAG
jgi:hypothetical protein